MATENMDNENKHPGHEAFAGAPGSATYGAVYVDRLRPCPRNPKWRWAHSCHLYTLAGWENDLHALAGRIGLRRAWYQGEARTMPHYDLTEAKRAAAVAAGAVQVTDEQMCGHLDLWRAARRQAREIALGEQRVEEERAQWPPTPQQIEAVEYAPLRNLLRGIFGPDEEEESASPNGCKLSDALWRVRAWQSSPALPPEGVRCSAGLDLQASF